MQFFMPGFPRRFSCTYFGAGCAVTPAFFAFLSALLVAPVADGAPRPRGVSNLWSMCLTADAVHPAAHAYYRKDYEEVTRLGCRFAAPENLTAIALRCEPSALTRHPAWFPYEVIRDSGLPVGICEVEVYLPDGWSARLYTFFTNIEWWDE